VSTEHDGNQLSIEITGGVGPHEAAAIVAALQQTLADEEKRRSRRPPRPKLPAWITVMRAKHPGRPESE